MVQIYTNAAEIQAAVGKVKGAVGGMQENHDTIKSANDALLDQFKGDGAGSYEGVAQELSRRLQAYNKSIQDLNTATDNAAMLIKDADQNVARMFSNLL
jgi:WXG100 family type VII secretion target